MDTMNIHYGFLVIHTEQYRLEDGFKHIFVQAYTTITQPRLLFGTKKSDYEMILESTKYRDYQWVSWVKYKIETGEKKWNFSKLCIILFCHYHVSSCHREANLQNKINDYKSSARSFPGQECLVKSFLIRLYSKKNRPNNPKLACQHAYTYDTWS